MAQDDEVNHEHQSEYITSDELLAIIPVTRQCIWKWEQEGKFPRRTWFGRKCVWKRVDVMRWVSQRERIAALIQELMSNGFADNVREARETVKREYPELHQV